MQSEAEQAARIKAEVDGYLEDKYEAPFSESGSAVGYIPVASFRVVGQASYLKSDTRRLTKRYELGPQLLKFALIRLGGQSESYFNNTVCKLPREFGVFRTLDQANQREGLFFNHQLLAVHLQFFGEDGYQGRQELYINHELLGYINSKYAPITAAIKRLDEASPTWWFEAARRDAQNLAFLLERARQGDQAPGEALLRAAELLERHPSTGIILLNVFLSVFTAMLFNCTHRLLYGTWTTGTTESNVRETAANFPAQQPVF